MEKDWYERWFGEDYKSFYPLRDQSQADLQIQALLRATSAQFSWRVLDVGCGSGRHVRALRAQGFSKVCGVDLSRTLLRDARMAGAVAQADMRRLPFGDRVFDLLGCFFTSFGYFYTFEEDMAALRELFRVVKPGGFLFLDLNNPEHVMRHLVKHDRRVTAARQVEQERFLDGDRVVKRIRIRNPDGAEKVYEERVRLFSLSVLEPVFLELGLSLEKIFGDEAGGEFSSEFSPRLGLLLRRAA